MSTRRLMMKRYLIPVGAFLLGTSLIAAAYFGLLTWAQGWDYAYDQFSTNRAYVIPIWLAFGLQSALYSVLRFRLFLPSSSTAHGGAMLGTSGGTSVTTMVASCLHHVTDVLPILGLSAAATFLTRYQRPFMRLSLAINVAAILVMLAVLYREWHRHQPVRELEPALEL
ncbi:MAG: hypothetical protein V1755_13315 [Chloroflexota bacterium]